MAVTGRQMEMAFGPLAAWGNPTAGDEVTNIIHFETDGGLKYEVGMVQDPSFNQAFLGTATPGLVTSQAIDLPGKLRYDDFAYIWEAKAMGLDTVTPLAAGPPQGQSHLMTLTTQVDGNFLTLGIDHSLYIVETAIKVTGWSLTQEDNGAMNQAFHVHTAKPIKDGLNVTADFTASTDPGLTNRAVQQQGVFRMKARDDSDGATDASTALAAGDVVTCESIAFNWDRGQSKPHVYGQDFVYQPLGNAFPTFELEITNPEATAATDTAGFTGIVAGQAYKADWTFTGGDINGTDTYTITYEFPYLQFMPDGFDASTAAADQVKPTWKMMPLLAPWAANGMTGLDPFRLTRINTRAAAGHSF